MCPLCGLTEGKPSWLALDFLDGRFNYMECGGCESLICWPMPDDTILAKMYDSSYCETAEAFGEDASLAKFSEVIEFIRSLPNGNFIDYGCGDGKLLVKVKSLGWDVAGIDFNPDFADLAKQQGIGVTSPDQATDVLADVLHLGDVIEHLTDLNAQFPEILKRIKPGGLLIAHGPLEANANLFYRVIKFNKNLRGRKATNIPPFHVILATSKGQLRLFERFDLKEIKFSVQEVAFPALDKLSTKDFYNPRQVSLYALRKVSQLVSSLNMRDSGNRYFYVGQKPLTAQANGRN